MFDRLLGKLDVEALSTKLVAYLPNLVGAVLIIIVFWIIGLVVRKAVSALLKRSHVPAEAQGLILRMLKFGVVLIALLTAADQLGIDITSLVAGLGIAGLALSFAAQDTVANVISGVTILIDRPFKGGDWISFGDTHASVTQIRLRTTVLTTFDNETLVMPNKDLAQRQIVNYTLTPKVRVRVPIGIAYKEDTEQARTILLSTLQSDERVLKEPAPTVLVTSLGDSSVNLELRFWTEDSIMKFPLMWEYTEKCKRALDNEGIEIPFPHLQLFLERTEAIKMLAAGRGQ